MSLDVFKAYVDGYGDRMFEYQLLSVQVGYWAGYYNRQKRPKSLKSIINTMVSKRQERGDKPEHVPTVDVEAFLAMERRFTERLAKRGD